MLDRGEIRRLGRVGMTREHLEAFARRLTHDDHVVIEATGNAAAVSELLAPHVGRVVIANPRQVRLIAEARIKTDAIDATVLARLYASNFLPEVWVPGQRTLALRRQVTRRNQIVRQRARLKTIIQSILHAHLVPPCPRADLLGPKGRAWLLAQPLPPDEAEAVARHLREHDRLSEDLRAVERELARDALANADVKRLMTVPGIDMVVAIGLLAAIGPVERFAGPDKLVAYLGLNPSVRQSGEGRPRHGRITKRGSPNRAAPMRAPCWSRRPGRPCAGPGRCGPSTSASPGAGATTSPPSQSPASSRSLSGTCCGAARTTPGCGRRCTPGSSAGPGAALRAADASRPARDRLRPQPGPNAPGGKAQGRAGRDRLSPADRGLDAPRSEGAHGRRKGGAALRRRGRALPSHPALCRAVAHGQPENSTRSRKNDWSTSSVVVGLTKSLPCARSPNVATMDLQEIMLQWLQTPLCAPALPET